MGNCRVRILVSKALLRSLKDEGTTAARVDASSVDATDSPDDDEVTARTITKVWSSDTTIRELCEETTVLFSSVRGSGVGGGDDSTCNNDSTVTILSLLEQDLSSLWDTTAYPPKDVTDLPVRVYPHRQGVRSQTLYDAGWFPTASLQLLLPSGRESPQLAAPGQYDDAQYNKQQKQQEQGNDKPKTRVQLVGSLPSSREQQLPAPSQVLTSVTERFAEDDEAKEEAEAVAARKERLKNRKMRKDRETERNRKLDDRIRKLELRQQQGKKDKNVSEQVRRMLIKSRATGASTLKQQDRLYFQCVVVANGADDDDDDREADTCKEEYRYFSPQDTVGKVATTFVAPSSLTSSSLHSEVLVRRDHHDRDSQPSYRKLPVLLRLYECISQKYLSEFDKLVVRFYDPSKEDGTRSVDDNSDEDSDAADVNGDRASHHDNDGAALSKGSANQTSKEDENAVGVVPRSDTGALIIKSKRLYDCIRAMEEKEGSAMSKKKAKKPPSKNSAAAQKVRQMQMKMKATGDSKRVKKVEDRFFVEIVTIDESTGGGSLNAVFAARNDTFERLLRDCGSVQASSSSPSYELLVPAVVDESSNDDDDDCEARFSFRRIENTAMTLEEAERSNILRCFDRLIVRVHSI